MAKRSAARGARAPKPAPVGRQTRSKKATTVAVADVEVVEEKAGEGIDAGIAVVTFLMLLAAILFVDAHLGRYDGGLFF